MPWNEKKSAHIWTCCEIYSVRASQLLSPSLPAANREAAFVHAISSAGVMYTLTRNCSLGDFDNCGCDDSRNGQRGWQKIKPKRPKSAKTFCSSSTDVCHVTRQAVTAGCGEAAATTWASARPSPSSSWTRWKRGRTHGPPWISTITKLDGRCVEVLWKSELSHMLLSCGRLGGFFFSSSLFWDVGVWVRGHPGPPTDCTV